MFPSRVRHNWPIPRRHTTRVRSRLIETLELRALLNVAPVAAADSYEMTQDGTLIVGNRLPEGATPLVWQTNGHAYMIVRQEADWAGAVAGSSSWEYHGVPGHLVSFNSKAESDFVVDHLLTGSDNVWIGLTDSAVEGQFKWVTGEALTYTNWASGEPNNSNNEDYVQQLPGNRWNDLPGDSVLPGYLVEFETPFAGGVLKNDTDADGDLLQAELVGAPTHGELTLAADGTFTYTPEVGFVGTDSFTYRASDGEATSNLATATITVNRFNSAPTAKHDVYSTPVNETRSVPASYGALANDVDAEADAFTATLLTQPKFGSVTLAADGSFVYTPAEDFVGIDWFSYDATDQGLTSKPATVTIQVTPMNDTPVARDEAYVLDEDGSLSVGTDPQTVVRQISLQSNSMVFDPSGNQLFVSAGNNLIPIDVFSGQVLAPFVIGQEPGRLVISDDGRFIYAAVNQNRNVKRFDTDTSTVDVSWQIGDFSQFGTAIGDMVAVPGQPNWVAIQQYYTCCSPRSGGVMIFDDGVLLPKHTAGGLGSSGGGDSIAFAEPGVLIGYSNSISSFGITQMQVDEEGITVTRQREWLLCCFNDTVAGGFGNVYHSSSTVLRASDFRILGSMPLRGSYVPDLAYDRVLVLSQEGTTVRITAVDPHTLEITGVVNVPNISGGAGDLVVRGPGDFAFRTPGKVVLVHDDVMAGQTGRGVMSNDFDPESDPITATLVTTTQHGELTFQADGTFEYVPNQNFFGEDTFTYQVTDGTHVSNAATVRLNVRGSNDVPLAAADEYQMPVRRPLVVSAASGVLQNDFDADGQPLTAVLMTAPTRGALQLAANGSFVYTPGESFVDGDSFVYRAYDGQTYSTPTTVVIEYDVPRVIVGSHTLLPDTPDQTIQILVTGGHDVSGLNLYAQVGDGGPERVQFDLPPGVDGPAITGIDVKSGSIFAGVPDFAQVELPIPQVASAFLSIAEAGGTVPADGVLATITIDTTGFYGGEWDLRLSDVLNGFTDGPFHTDFAGLPAIVANGKLVIEQATITRREILYGGSSLGDAPASDKRALLPGQTATFANYSSYVGGINGIAVEMADALGTPTLGDFAFYVGNSNDTSTWQPAPAPVTFAWAPNGGAEGSGRAVIRWADGAITGKWLMVRVKSTANTGLAAEDVFYFGNAIGESGDNPLNAIVNATDVIQVRDNPRGPLNPAGIDNRHDFNRDGLVNATDLVIARDHATSPLTALRLITPTGAVPSTFTRSMPKASPLVTSKLAWAASEKLLDRGRELRALDALFTTEDFLPSSLTKRRVSNRAFGREQL